MKKIISFLLATLMIACITACGVSKATISDTVEDKVKHSVRSRIMVEFLWDDIQGTPDVTYYINEIDKNKFEVTGKVTIKDKYGDKYTGKYDAIVEYDPETDECDTDIEIGDLIKE